MGLFLGRVELLLHELVLGDYVLHHLLGVVNGRRADLVLEAKCRPLRDRVLQGTQPEILGRVLQIHMKSSEQYPKKVWVLTIKRLKRFVNLRKHVVNVDFIINK